MTMPTSGSIGLKYCTAQACSSIALAVDGNQTGDKSLSTLSTTAGKSAPHCMREFYGYPPVNICFGGTTTCTSSATCCDIWFPICMLGRISPNVMTLCFDWDFNESQNSNVCIWTKENAGSWINKVTCSITSSGSFTEINIDYDDTLCGRIAICSVVGLAAGSLCLHSPPAAFTTGSGTINRCTPYDCEIFVG